MNYYFDTNISFLLAVSDTATAVSLGGGFSLLYLGQTANKSTWKERQKKAIGFCLN